MYRTGTVRWATAQPTGQAFGIQGSTSSCRLARLLHYFSSCAPGMARAASVFVLLPLVLCINFSQQSEAAERRRNALVCHGLLSR